MAVVLVPTEHSKLTYKSEYVSKKNGRTWQVTISKGYDFTNSEVSVQVYNTKTSTEVAMLAKKNKQVLTSGGYIYTFEWIAETEIPNYCEIRVIGDDEEESSIIEPTFTNSVDNATLTHSTTSTGIKVTLTCADGYVFDGTPEFSLAVDDDPFSDPTAIDVSVNSDNNIATGTISSTLLTAATTFTATGSTKTATITPELVNNVAHTTAVCNNTGSTFNVGLSCADGYEFDGVPTCVLSLSPFADDIDVTLNVDSTNKIATGSVTNDEITNDSTFTFTGSTKETTTPEPTFTNNVANTTLSHEYSDGVYKLTLTAESGYVFKGSVIVTYTPTGGETSTKTMAIDDTYSTAYLEITTAEVTDFIFTGETTPYVPDTKVTNNIADTTLSNVKVVGTMVTGVVTGNYDNRYFKGCKATWGTETSDLTPSTDTAHSLNIALMGVTKGSEVVLTGEYRGACTSTNNLTGATLTGLKDLYWEGETISVTAVADSDTHFSDTNPPKLIWYDALSVPTETAFTLSDDKKTATATYTLTDVQSEVEFTEIEVSGATYPDTEVTGYGSVNVYVVDNDALNEFAQARFIYTDGKETTLTPDGDLAEYVNRLHKVYCKVGKTTATTIKCGNTDTKISCASLNAAVVSLDMGNVVIPSPTTSTNDFKGSIDIFVPFVGFVAVDAIYSGKTITLKYDVDLVTGEGVYYLLIDSIPIATGEVNVSSEVLYRTSTTESLGTIGTDKFKTAYLKGLEPYAIYKHFAPLADDYRNNDLYKVTIGDIQGFAKVTAVTDLTCDCLNDERQAIFDLLETGVFF